MDCKKLEPALDAIAHAHKPNELLKVMKELREIYGLSQSDSARPVSLTLTRINQSALRKLGESIGLASHISPLKIQWNQFASGSIASRSLALDLSQIPRGRYLLRIEAGSAWSTREITID